MRGWTLGGQKQVSLLLHFHLKYILLTLYRKWLNFQPGKSETATCVTCKARGSQYLFFPERFLGQRALSLRTHVHICKAIFKCAPISMELHPKVLHTNRKARGTVDCVTSEKEIWGPPHQNYHQPQTPLTCELSLGHRESTAQCQHPELTDQTIWCLVSNPTSLLLDCTTAYLRYKKKKLCWHLNWFSYTSEKVSTLAHCKAIFQISLIGVNCQTILNNLSFLLCQRGACKRSLQQGSYWYINLFTLQTCLTQTKPEWAVLGQKKRGERQKRLAIGAVVGSDSAINKLQVQRVNWTDKSQP